MGVEGRSREAQVQQASVSVMLKCYSVEKNYEVYERFEELYRSDLKVRRT